MEKIGIFCFGIMFDLNYLVEIFNLHNNRAFSNTDDSNCFRIRPRDIFFRLSKVIGFKETYLVDVGNIKADVSFIKVS